MQPRRKKSDAFPREKKALQAAEGGWEGTKSGKKKQRVSYIVRGVNGKGGKKIAIEERFRTRIRGTL